MILGTAAFSNHRYHAQTKSLLEQLDKAALAVVRLVSMDPSKGLPSNFSQPGAVPALGEPGQLRDYRSLIDQIAVRGLSAREQDRLDAITSKLAGFGRGNRSDFENLAQEPVGSKETNHGGPP